MTTLPPDLAAQHLAIVGRTGSGKTYAAKGLVETLMDQQRRVIVLDPTGAWHGLTSKADGSRGYQVAVLGGDHGGAPLRVDRAAQLGEWLARHGEWTVLDLSEFLIGDRHRFVEEFAAAIYRHNRTPLHLVVDEADEFMPQNPLPETRRMLHRMDQIVRRGRIKGFRVMMITQRPAVIHKNCLTQANALIAMRLTSPQDRKAIEAWVEGNADAGQAKEVLGSLARLPRGEGWVWAPEVDFLKRVQFPKIRTFDSSASPEDGAPVAKPTAQAFDYGPLAELMAEPKALDVKPGAIVMPGQPDPRALEAADRRGYERGLFDGKRAGYRHGWDDGFTRAVRALQQAHTEGRPEEPPADGGEKPEAAAPMFPEANRAAPYTLPPPAGAAASSQGGKRRMLIALAQFPAGCTTKRLALLAGLVNGSGTWAKYLGQLRAAGLVENLPGGGGLRITGAGRRELGTFEPLPTGRELVAYWQRWLGEGGMRRMFDGCVHAYPRGITQERLAHQCDMVKGSGTWAKYLGKLRSLELIEGRDELRAAAELFQ
jgi:uncharacterized protein